MKVAFIGQREIELTSELAWRLDVLIRDLILDRGARRFIFGEKNAFVYLCHKLVTKWSDFMETIERECVRATNRFLTKEEEKYLAERFELTDYPVELTVSDADRFLVRNKVMVDRCDILVICCDKAYGGFSYTRLAADYAERQNKEIINLFGLE